MSSRDYSAVVQPYARWAVIFGALAVTVMMLDVILLVIIIVTPHQMLLAKVIDYVVVAMLALLSIALSIGAIDNAVKWRRARCDWCATSTGLPRS